MNIIKESFGKTNQGQEVFLFTLRNDNDMTVKIMTYGGIITSLQIPDKNGKFDDVVLGFNSLAEYQAPNPWFGALVGRYGNRIAKGKFVLNGKEYHLAINNGANHLHGGNTGFNKVVWDAQKINHPDEVGLQLTYLSKDGEEGYPGNLTTVVKYLINNQNELVIQYEATTDQPTFINLTQHSYFNLAGESSGDVLGHEVMINADHFTAVTDDLIPTGELRVVKASPMDFTRPKTIGTQIAGVEGGYDHNYVLNKKNDELSLMAWVREPRSGRIMEVMTTEPGVQFYVGNNLDGTIRNKVGRTYQQYAGFCLEAQHFPDSPNQPDFPSTLLKPGETYRQVTIYKFLA